MSVRLLLIDNYDSFTYNLVQAFMVLGAEVDVRRNDAITVEQAKAADFTHLCISPGPGTPYDAGVSMDMIRAFAGSIPVFGVCLGHQSIVEVFGGKVVRAGRLMPTGYHKGTYRSGCRNAGRGHWAWYHGVRTCRDTTAPKTPCWRSLLKGAEDSASPPRAPGWWKRCPRALRMRKKCGGEQP